MTTSSPRTDRFRALITVGAVAVLYLLGAEMAWGYFGAELAVVLFPPAGVTLAAFVLTDRRHWPLIASTIFVVEILVDLRHGLSLPIASGYAVANTVEPVAAAIVVLALGRRTFDVGRLDRRRPMARFLLGTLGVGCVAGALIGATVKVIDAPSTYWIVNAIHWWAGDGLGMLVFGAPLIIWHTLGFKQTLRPVWELVLFLIALIVATVLVFRVWDESFAYIVGVMLLWAAFRFGVGGVGLAGIVTTILANGFTAAGEGPFAAMANTSVQVQLGLTKLFYGTTLLAAWFFAIETNERVSAVRSHREERDARLAAETQRAVGEAGASLARAATPTEVIEALLAHVTSELKSYTAVVGLLDERQERFMEWSAADLSVGGVAGPSPGDDLPGPLAVAGARPTWIGTREQLSSTYPHAVEQLNQAIVSLVVLPLPPPARPGYMVLTWAHALALNERGHSYLSAVIQLGARALARAELYLAERIATERVAALQGITAALARAASDCEVGRLITVDARNAVGAASCRLDLISDSGALVTTTSGHTHVLDDQAAREPHVDPLTYVRAALHERHAVFVEASGAEANEHDAHDSSSMTWAVFPLVRGGLALGAVTFSFAQRLQTMGSADRAFAEAVADQCAQALERTQRQATEHEAVLQMQRALLAHVIDRPARMDVETRYLPAPSPLNVGGDWFDVIALDSERVALFVGDVVGRGMKAAIAMSQLRSATRALASRLGPAELLSELDRYAQSVPDATFATLAVVVLDLATKSATYSLAGHPPPLLRRVDGRSVLLGDALSAPLGVASDLRPESTVGLFGNDLLVMYTDGLIERRGEHLDVGLERLRSAVEGVANGDVHWCDQLVARCLAGAERRDDVAVLAVRLPLEESPPAR